MRESQGVQPRAKVGQGSTRAWQKYPGQTMYRLKNGDQNHTIDRKSPIKASANPQIFSCRQLPSDHLKQRNSLSNSCRREILSFGTHPRNLSLQFSCSSVVFSCRREILGSR